MRKQFLTLVLLLSTPAAALPQRYGRPYTLAENPQYLLEVRVDNKLHYFRAPDLRKMHRSVVTLTDPATNASHVYEGVALEELLPSTALASGTAVIEIAFGSHQTLAFAGADLDSQVAPMIADTIDGKRLSGSAPYYFAVKFRNKPAQTFTGVLSITVKPSARGSS